MLAFLDVCSDSGFLRALNILGILINLAKIIIPIILIVVGAINYGKAALSSEEEAIRKTSKAFMKNIVAGLVVFIVPTFVTGMLSIYNGYADIEDTFRGCSICLESSDDCKGLINAAVFKEEQALKDQEASEQSELNDADAKNDAETQNENDSLISTGSSNPRGNNTGSGSRSSSSGSTQASSFFELGERAYQGDTSAMTEWIEKVAPIVDSAQHSKYGIKNSMIIAQIILESGWMHTPSKYNSDGTSLVGCNNVLSVNYDMGKAISEQDSTWSKNPQKKGFSVSIYDSNGDIAYEVQQMRVYDSIEDCIEDYANLVYLYHPECKNNNDMSCYKSFLTGYTNEAAYYKISSVIDSYNLAQYD